jgi:hypothetical protein
MTLHDEPFDIAPIRALVGNQRNPALIADVWSFEVAGIFNQKLLQSHGGFEADTQVAVPPFEDRESFRAGFECRMSPALNFVSLG